jgi:hypothetical protein
MYIRPELFLLHQANDNDDNENYINERETKHILLKKTDLQHQNNAGGRFNYIFKKALIFSI